MAERRGRPNKGRARGGPPKSESPEQASPPPDAPGPERLQKVLANAGVGSRREVESWIEEGRLTVNGVRAELGVRVGPRDQVRLDGERIAAQAPRRSRVLCYHKPVGEVTTRKDEQGRPTVFENLPKMRSGRWITVGRLDVNTSGVLLFTNDGELANRLMHPSYQLTREYAVRILGEPTPEALAVLTRGVDLDGEQARFDTLELRGGSGANKWFHVTLGEGRNREVRRLWESQGLKVSRLIRVRYGSIVLPRALRAGRYDELGAPDIGPLYESVGLSMTVPPPRKPASRARRKPGAMRRR